MRIRAKEFTVEDFEAYKHRLYDHLTEITGSGAAMFREVSKKKDAYEQKGNTTDPKYKAMRSLLVDLSSLVTRAKAMAHLFESHKEFDPGLVRKYLKDRAVIPLMDQIETLMAKSGVKYPKLVHSVYDHLAGIAEEAKEAGQQYAGHTTLIQQIYGPYVSAMQAFDGYANDLIDIYNAVQGTAAERPVRSLMDSGRTIYEKLVKFGREYRSIKAADLPERSRFLIDVVYDLKNEIKKIQKSDFFDEKLYNIHRDDFDKVDQLERFLKAGPGKLTVGVDETINRLKTYLRNLKELDRD